ncbi:NAD(P)H-dependent flavin oxidoreductase [Silvanigrella sp.]|jgi:nitronate monooxygenase|uniref:NAD(P)H-dependent flavin oxidoreductase n=1 Tax=Silvanigrella sp. TaxID=2024976 RepID=UPI0037C6626C
MISTNLPKIFSNEFYQIFHLKYPIIQAPMAGGSSCPNLVAAVANEGVLGFLAAGYLSAEILEKQIIETKAKTNTIFGVNLFIIDPLIQNNFVKPENICAIEKQLGIFKTKKIKIHIDEEIDNKIDVIIKHNVKVVSFTFGLPNKKIIEKLKLNNIYTIGSSTNIIEAKIIEDLGLDAVVAQGIEAGGHRASFLNHNMRDEIGLISLLQEYQGLVHIPVIASVGIITGKGLLAVQILGATSSRVLPISDFYKA